MKKTLLLAVLFVGTTISTFGAVTIRYYNKDSRSHTMTVKMDGSTKSVTFESSRTSSVTIQGGGTSCIIETPCGRVEVKDGANVEIKDGCIKVN